jgi:4-hydroxy-tetrahydrodipicolinate reductase
VSAARLCVLGATGRMGRAVIEAAAERHDLRVSHAVDRAEAAAGATVAGVAVEVDMRAALRDADVYIDFTSAAATVAAARLAAELARPAVIGTTGLGAQDDAAVEALARVAPVVIAANFSLGVNLLVGLVAKAARALGPSWDAEIVEIHHRAKRDAPSGTALALARAVADGHGVDYRDVACHGRDGDVGARPAGQIGVHAVRGGDVVGEHTVTLFGAAERLELSHRATSRAIFAAGALHAAAWVVKQPPGRYDMLDVLALR